MPIKTCRAPKRSSGRANGFEFVIQVNKQYNGMHTWPDHWLCNDIHDACENTLGRAYRSTLQRGGKRKWYCEEQHTFTRFYFRSAACQTLVLLNLDG
jgi:hypothetical protein